MAFTSLSLKIKFMWVFFFIELYVQLHINKQLSSLLRHHFPYTHTFEWRTAMGVLGVMDQWISLPVQCLPIPTQAFLSLCKVVLSWGIYSSNRDGLLLPTRDLRKRAAFEGFLSGCSAPESISWTVSSLYLSDVSTGCPCYPRGCTWQQHQEVSQLDILTFQSGHMQTNKQTKWAFWGMKKLTLNTVLPDCHNPEYQTTATGTTDPSVLKLWLTTILRCKVKASFKIMSFSHV